MAAGLTVSALCPSAHANITIVPTFDTSITSSPNAADIEGAINAAISEIESYIATPTTIPVLFQDVTYGLGTSSTYGGSFPYAAYVADLHVNQTLSANDNTALATLPAGLTNPANGGLTMHLSTPLLRAIGEPAAGDIGGIPDSTIALYTGICNLSRTGTQDPDKYDLQQVTMHELCEVLGAGGGGSQLPTLDGDVGSLDIYRYSAPGVRSFNNDPNATAYLSIDGGATNLSYFNQQDGGDFADWAGDLNHGPQVQDAYSTPGVQVDLNANEIIPLDVVGYNLTPAGMALVAKGSNALMIAGGLRNPGVVEVGRLNVETGGASAAVVDLQDAVRLARKSAGLDPLRIAVPGLHLKSLNGVVIPTAKASAVGGTAPKFDIIVRHLLPARKA